MNDLVRGMMENEQIEETEQDEHEADVKPKKYIMHKESGKE